jgi:hypothetical protein
MNFIKKWWSIILAVVLGLAVVFTIKHYAAKYDNVIAQYMADKTMARHHAAIKKIRDKYEPLIVIATAQVDAANGAIGDLSNTVVAKDKELTAARNEIAKLKSCDDRLIATNVLLDQAQGFILYLDNAYKVKVGALNLAWNYKYTLKNDEMEAVVTQNAQTIAELGACVKRATLSLLGAKNRLYLGGGMGWNPITGQPAVTVGVFFGVIRLPFRIF